MIDCDIHNEVPRIEALFPYLSEHWREHIIQSLFKGPVDHIYPPNSPIAARPESTPAGGPAGSDLDLLRAQALDGPAIEVGILACAYSIDSLHHPDAAVALASAVNDWQAEEWLAREPRLRASIVVPVQHPMLAAREIERMAGHPGFVQVLLPARTHLPLGNRLYQPLWEAIARHDLVAGIHFGGVPGNPPTPSGWPTYFVEEYAAMAQTFATQVTSLISEGVFDLYPSLRVTLLESGFTWIPAHMWRFDKEWKNLRRLVPWVKRAPSDYMREHMRVTVQPLDAPPEPRQLLQIVEQLGSDDMLMYASDYPHAHATDPAIVLVPALSDSLARKVLSENARSWYRLS